MKRDPNTSKSCAICAHFRPEHERCRAYHRRALATEGHVCPAWVRIFHKPEVKP